MSQLVKKKHSDPPLYKTFCFTDPLLNQRLLEHVNSHNILHNSQIGFPPKNRTADHVLTLRTLVDKYVHYQTKKFMLAL